MLAQVIGHRPCDLVQYEGSTLERLLFDLEVIGAAESVSVSVKDRILAKRAKLLKDRSYA